MQDEIKRNTRDGFSSKSNDEENCALAIKESKGIGKISHSKSDSHRGGKKDMMKAKWFHCHKMGHFATNFPLKKSKEKSSGGARVRLWPPNSNWTFPSFHASCLQ